MFRRPATFSFRLVMLAAIAGFLFACSGTRLAYEGAETLEAKAFVVTEHYSAVLKEANDLADQPGVSRELVDRLKAADRTAQPLVLQLRTAAQTYDAAKNAQTEAELQAALNDAALAVSNFINVLRAR